MRIFFYSIVALLLACQPVKTSVQKENTSQKKLNVREICQYNVDSSFVACILKENDIGNSLSNLIVSKYDNDSVVYSEKIQFVEVKWISNEILEIKKGMNYLKDFDTNVEIYNYNVETMELKKVGVESKLK